MLVIGQILVFNVCSINFNSNIKKADIQMCLDKLLYAKNLYLTCQIAATNNRPKMQVLIADGKNFPDFYDSDKKRRSLHDIYLT